MTKFNINTAMFVMGMWTDEDGNHISENEYNKILSASTWGEIDPDLLDLDDPGQIPYDDVIGDRAETDKMSPADILDQEGYGRAEIELLQAQYPFEEDFREYVSGINL